MAWHGIIRTRGRHSDDPIPLWEHMQFLGKVSRIHNNGRAVVNIVSSNSPILTLPHNSFFLPHNDFCSDQDAAPQSWTLCL